jgi:hypothetical protein
LLAAEKDMRQRDALDRMLDPPTLLPDRRRNGRIRGRDLLPLYFRIQRVLLGAANCLAPKAKTAQLESKEYFCREYSLTTTEAFITVFLTRSFEPIRSSRTSKEILEPYGSLILGFDPAGMDANRPAVLFRQRHRIACV